MSHVSPGKGVAIVVAIAVFVIIYLALAHFLGVSEFWVGFLWLFYWAGIEGMNFSRLIDSVLGAVIGISAGLALHTLPGLLDEMTGVEHAGMVTALVLVVFLVYASVMGWLKLWVNNATMLFLTVVTISHIQASGSFLHMYAGLLLGAAFFGGLLWSVTTVVKRVSLKNA